MNEFYKEYIITDSEVGRIELPEVESIEQEVESNAEITDWAAKYLSESEKLEAINEQKTNSLDAIMCSMNMEERSNLSEKYNEFLAQSRIMTEAVGEIRKEMEKEGWIFSRDEKNAFKVVLETNPKGKKLFRITDRFGETPVQIGDAFLAYLSASNSIPEVVRNRIVESFTFRGDEAQDIYAAV